MGRLDVTTIDELQETLESVDESKPTQRLVAAIAYKNGITQSELAQWFDVERKTIYNWLTRLEERDLESAVRDGPRPGRPRKLSTKQLETLEDFLLNPPTNAGYDVPAWTTGLVRQFIRDQFETDYSHASCRRLMREAGLSYQPPREAAGKAETEERRDVAEEVRDLDHGWIPR